MSDWINGNLQGNLSIGQGERGKSIEYEWRGTELGIRQEGEEEYQFVDLAGSGAASGREIELQVGSGYIQWRYKGEESWNNLISIDSLKGGKGDKGEQGERGPQGLPGKDGADGKNGVDGTNGQDGVDGVTPNITIGTVTTLEAGQQATVAKRGTIENPIFDFGIPQGKSGSNGATPDMTEFEKKINEQYETIEKKVDDHIANCNGGGSSTEEKLILKYTHNSNKVIQVTRLDFETGVFTCVEAHGLKSGDKLLLDFTPEEGEYFNQTKILKELFDFNWTTWYFMVVEVVSDIEFKLKNNANNTYLTYKESNTPNLDFNAFRFQQATQITLSNLNLSRYKKLKFGLNLITIGQYYCNSIKVLKLTNVSNPFNQNISKIKGWISPETLLYPNMTMDINVNSSYGHSCKFRNDLIENVVTIQENRVLRSVKMTSIGCSNTFAVHENYLVTRNYIFDNVFQGVGYEDGNSFLDSITIPQELKILNGSIVEIYSLEG